MDRGQTVARCVGMAFQQSPHREGGRPHHKIWAVILKRTTMPSSVTGKCLVSFPSDTTLCWCWLDGILSFEISAEHRSSSTWGSAEKTPLLLRPPGLREDLTEHISHLQQSGYVFSFETGNAVLLRLLYLFYELY